MLFFGVRFSVQLEQSIIFLHYVLWTILIFKKVNQKITQQNSSHFYTGVSCAFYTHSMPLHVIILHPWLLIFLSQHSSVTEHAWWPPLSYLEVFPFPSFMKQLLSFYKSCILFMSPGNSRVCIFYYISCDPQSWIVHWIWFFAIYPLGFRGVVFQS